MKTTETIPRNCVLLTPDEAAGVSVFGSILLKRGAQVEEWRTLSVPNPRMVAGTGLNAIGYDNANRILCVKRECLPELERLRKALHEDLESFGYVGTFKLWESWIRSETTGCYFCIKGGDAASVSTGCVWAGDDRRAAGVGDVDELGHGGRELSAAEQLDEVGKEER